MCERSSPDVSSSSLVPKKASALCFFGGCVTGVALLFLLKRIQSSRQPHHKQQRYQSLGFSSGHNQQFRSEAFSQHPQTDHSHPSVDGSHRKGQLRQNSEGSQPRHFSVASVGAVSASEPEKNNLTSPFSDSGPEETPFTSSSPSGTVVDLDPCPTLSVGFNRQRRATAFSAPSTNLEETREYRPEVHDKPTLVMDMLIKTLSKSALFDQQNDAAHRVAALAMHRRSFRKGELITAQGKLMQAADHCFYVVLEGEVTVIEDATVRRVLLPGAIFGEPLVMFLQDSFPVTHRVETEACVCAVLHQEQFRHIVTQAAVDKMTLYKGFLDRLEWLGGLSKREKIQLADCLQACRYKKGEYLIEYGTVGVWLFIILEGTVSVQGRRQGEAVHVCSFGPGDCVGELEFLNHHRTVADVRAEGPVKAAKLHRDHFEMCMGPIADVLRRTAKSDEKYAYYRWATDVPSPTRPQPGGERSNHGGPFVHAGFDPAPETS